MIRGAGFYDFIRVQVVEVNEIGGEFVQEEGEIIDGDITFNVKDAKQGDAGWVGLVDDNDKDLVFTDAAINTVCCLDRPRLK